MANLEPGVLVTIITIIASATAITLGTALPVIMEGKAVAKALEGIARQPEAAPQLRTTLLISLALLESTAIYVLLVVLVLLFANPLLDRFLGA